MLEIAFIYLNSKLGFKIWMEIPDPDHVGTRGGSCSSIFLIHMLTTQLDPIVDIHFLIRVRVLSVWRLISLSLQVIQINLYLAFQCCKQQCHQLRASHCWLHHLRLVMARRHSYSSVEDQDVSDTHTMVPLLSLTILLSSSDTQRKRQHKFRSYLLQLQLSWLCAILSIVRPSR